METFRRHAAVPENGQMDRLVPMDVIHPLALAIPIAHRGRTNANRTNTIHAATVVHGTLQ